MNFRVLVEHSRINQDQLKNALSERFARSGLQPNEWKSCSQKYKELDDIESQLIWGCVEEGGKIVYGLLREGATMTLIWIEYEGASDWTFKEVKRIMENSLRAIKSSQKKWRHLKIIGSGLYQEVEEKTLDVTIELESWKARFGHFSAREIVVFFTVFLGVLVYKLNAAQNITPQTFLEQWETYLLDPAALTFLGAVIWTALLLVVRLLYQKVEVKFNVKA